MEEQTQGKGVHKIYNFCAYFKLHVYAQFLSCTATSTEHVSTATTTNTSINNKLLPIQEKQQTICDVATTLSVPPTKMVKCLELLHLPGVQLKSGPYFNISNLFTKIYNMLYYTTNLYLQ
jgi:hypothetical protein